MSVTSSTGRRLHAALDLLDRQLRDRNGRLCGNVDDIELARSADTGEVYVTALLSGPGHLAYRLGRRRFGRWLRDAAVHSAPPGTEGSGRIPTERIEELGPVIALAVDADELSSSGGERWVRDHIISNIPGGASRADE
jgi:hypothetical protein